MLLLSEISHPFIIITFTFCLSMRFRDWTSEIFYFILLIKQYTYWCKDNHERTDNNESTGITQVF